MFKKIFKIIIIGLVVLFVLSLIPGEQEVDTKIIIDENRQVVSKGDRLLGIDVTMSKSDDYSAAFAEAQGLGMDFITLSLAWDDIEKSPEVYGNDFLAIANSFYPARNIAVALVLSPIDTNNLRVPADLQGKSFDDPEVISRFNKMMDYTLGQMPNVNYVSVAIGNEIDVYLGRDDFKWQVYEEFFKQTSSYVKNKKRVNVGTKITFDGIFSDNAKSINKFSDVVMTTYYPLNKNFIVEDPAVVSDDFKRLVDAYPSREISLLEAGYPSGSKTGSSQNKQARFFVELFKAWDLYQENIRTVNLNWLHDRSSSELSGFKTYYGISDKKFIDYLGTLGFIENNGVKKQAFEIIKIETKQRGW